MTTPSNQRDLPPYNGAPAQPARAAGEFPVLTTPAGCPYASDSDQLTVGPRGPTLLEDREVIEKLAFQNRERIPERVVHAKGWGAYGTLKITGDISRYTCAKVLQPGTETPALARFSTVGGESGAADYERDVRGFALKFYSEEGNWDLVANNTPVFFVRDSFKFPDFIRVLKRHPVTHQRNPTALWDFFSLSPESLHQVTYLFGDRGIPKTFMNMNGYGSHTFSLWNEQGERFWVKFHFKTQQGIDFLTNEEAEKLTGVSRDSGGEDLYNAIDQGKFPRWKFQIQVMTVEQAERCPFNPFDLTKVWPHADYPLIDVGELELNRNPSNYFAEVEQAAFSPSNLVPGIGISPDKMLQTRVFSYGDTHRYRLGVNYDQIPVNRPRCPVANYHRDGFMNVMGGLQSTNPNAYYAPNSFSGPVAQPRVQEPPMQLSGAAARYDHRLEDDYEQVRVLYAKVMKPDEKERLYDNIAGSWPGVPDMIVERQLAQFRRVHPDYEKGCRAAWERVKASSKYPANAIPQTAKTPHMIHDEQPKATTTLQG